MSSSELLDSFLDTVNETAELSTERPLCPQLRCNAVISKIEPKTGMSKPRNPEDAPRPWLSLTATYTLESVEAMEALGRDESVKLQGNPIFISMKEDRSGLDPDRNVDLARLTTYAGISIANKTLREIMADLLGAYLCVDIKHRTYKRQDGTEGTQAVVVPVSAAE